MQIDLVGRVRNTKLPLSHPLLPVFEAIVNSIQAIRERGALEIGKIRVQIKRSGTLFTSSATDELNENTLGDIVGFEITDNGVGFTDENFGAFDTMDTRAKARIGGKGVGRLLWLKAFDYALVDSVYHKNGGTFRRAFRFALTPHGVEDATLEQMADESEVRTTVQLIGFHENYRDAASKSTQSIARRILEHCLQYFVLSSAPAIRVEDPQSKELLDLHDLYAREFRPQHQVRQFDIEGETFQILDILLTATSEKEHRLNFCAHQRVVRSQKLSGRIAHTDQPFRDDRDGTDVLYWGCVVSPMLDARVDAERTDFEIAREGELMLNVGPTWEKIERAAMSQVQAYLEPRTRVARDKSMNRIRHFIEENPRYRPLLGHRSDRLGGLPGTLSDETLEEELHSLYEGWKRDLQASVSKNLQQLPEEPKAFAAHREEFVKLIGEIHEVSRSELADYVVQRAAVLSFFEKMLGMAESGKFQNEDMLHEIFFPKRTTSDHIDFDSHNLWLLDERLVYHAYLASDLPFRSQASAPVQVDSGLRADLIIYNGRLAFSAGVDHPPSSVVIVEFKRPERGEYSDSENPIRQVLEYVDLIRAGKARRPNGSVIGPVPESTPFYCYIVATLTPRLRQEAKTFDYLELPDRQGFFSFSRNSRAYVELMDYRKVLQEARKRNKVFFDKLRIK